MLRTYLLPIDKVIQETADAITLRMTQPLVDRIVYLPGQYLTLAWDLKGTRLYRSYSISSTPQLDRHLDVTIKRLPGGRVSNHIHEQVKAGDLLEFLRPSGRFTLETANREQRQVILIGAGSGMTPLMSMLRAVLYNEPHSRVDLLYANRHAADIIFLDRLNRLNDTFPDRLSVQHVLSQPEEGASIPHWQGRLTAEGLRQWLAELPLDESLPRIFYLCGPPSFMNMLRATLLTYGVGEDQVHEERFVADETVTQAQTQLAGPPRWVSIQFGEEQYRIKVPQGTTILQAALAQGVSIPYSCKRGLCSTCMSTLLQGEVSMDDPGCLLDFEVQRGLVLTCQARPASNDVQIQIGFGQ